MFKKATINVVCLVTVSFLNFNVSCKEQKSKSVEKIIIGSGGGFTGVTKDYIINKDGSIQEEDNKKAISYGKITKKTFHEIIKKSEETGFQTLNLNEQGNFYYYIEFTGKDKNHRVTWSSQSSEDNKKIQQLYTYIMDIISKSTKQ
jgi:hypothetical protein